MKSIKVLLITIFLFVAISSNAQVAVIAHKSVPDAAISADKLSQIYLLKDKTWSGGQAILPFTIKSDNKTVEKFYSSIDKSLSQMKKLWMKLQLTGEGIPPQALGSEEEVLSRVSSTPGAIGFVDASKVNDDVKVLLEIK